jgi:hypothetical protein
MSGVDFFEGEDDELDWVDPVLVAFGIADD